MRPKQTKNQIILPTYSKSSLQRVWTRLASNDVAVSVSRRPTLTLGHVGSSRPPWGDLKGAVSPHAWPLPRSWVSREPRCRPPLEDLLLCSHHRLQPPPVSQPVMHFLHPYKIYSRGGGLFSTFRPAERTAPPRAPSAFAVRSLDGRLGYWAVAQGGVTWGHVHAATTLLCRPEGTGRRAGTQVHLITHGPGVSWPAEHRDACVEGRRSPWPVSPV